MDWDEIAIVFAVLVLLPGVVWSLVARVARSKRNEAERQREPEDAELSRIAEHEKAEARLIQVLEARIVQLLESTNNDRAIPR